MKLEVLKKDDSHGITIHSKILTIRFHFWRIWRYKRSTLLGWLLKLQFGKGAGYIDGSTSWIGWRARGGSQYFHKKPPVLRIGFTRNGNRCPYGFR